MENRIKMLRLAHGFSLEALSAQMGGLVTKQALSKYESGLSMPSPVVLAKLAAALNVKAAQLWAEPTYQIEVVAYRKKAKLTKTDSAHIESRFKLELERRVVIQDLTNSTPPPLCVQQFPVDTIEQAEEAANQLRVYWNLGQDPIGNLTNTLESFFVHVIEFQTGEDFDGISGIARDAKSKIKATAVASRGNLTGERQRSNLAHEVAHIVMKVGAKMDEEKAARRFAGAFLAPAKTLLQEVGTKRSHLPMGELALHKRRFGMSMQSLIYRLHELGVITDVYYRQWFQIFSRQGFRKAEPLPLPAEKPEWFQRNVLRAFAEGLLSRAQASEMLGEPVNGPEESSLVSRREFMKLPMERRRQALEEQARRLEGYYHELTENDDIGGGDFVDHK